MSRPLRRPARGRMRERALDVDARREEIVTGALELLDAEGYEGMSLRLLARHMRMHAPGLYWYVESKQDLIDLMAKRILEEGFAKLKPLAPGQTWQEWMIELTLMARRAMLARRDGARILVDAYLLRTSAITPIVELSLEVLENAGFPRRVALGATMTLLRFATGVTLDEQMSPIGKTPGHAEEMFRKQRPFIDEAQWPRAAAAFTEVFAHHAKRDRESMFRWSAELIVRGLTQMLDGAK